MSEAKAIETFKSMVGLATEGLKALLLVNGGAVVALLTYVGSSKGPAPSPSSFALPASMFLLGLILCVGAFCTAYATQYYLYNEQFPERGFKPRSHMRYFKWTATLVALSLVAFSAGALTSVSTFQSSSATAPSAQTVPAAPSQPQSVGAPKK